MVFRLSSSVFAFVAAAVTAATVDAQTPLNCSPPSKNVHHSPPSRSPKFVEKSVSPGNAEELCMPTANPPYVHLVCVGQGWPPSLEHENWYCETNGECGGGNFLPSYNKSVNGVPHNCQIFRNSSDHSITAVANYYLKIGADLDKR
jgi:hypothetical protein